MLASLQRQSGNDSGIGRPPAQHDVRADIQRGVNLLRAGQSDDILRPLERCLGDFRRRRQRRDAAVPQRGLYNGSGLA